jgi:release factor glutamine methyltransferase
MDLRTALLQGQKLLEDSAIAAPRLTAEVLLAHAIGCERAWLYAHSDEQLREVWWIHYGRYLHDRLQGRPTQYITGRQEFYGREFRVTPDVLIPRPETEHVIEAFLMVAGEIARRDGPNAILDIGTGSGAIAVTLALEARLEKGSRVFASDISNAALKVAAGNARTLGATVGFVCCDLGAAFPASSFDVVVSNPPYVPEIGAGALQREVREHEPAVALYGGADGFAVYRRLIPEAARLLRPSGWLIMELAYNAVDTVTEILVGNLTGTTEPVAGGGSIIPEFSGGRSGPVPVLRDWRDVSVTADLAGLPRVITARLP